MKTKDLLEIDYRTTEGRKIINKALLKIPAIAKRHTNTDVPLESLLKALSVVCRKYEASVLYITPLYIPGEVDMWKVLATYNSTSFTTHGCCLYEALAKALILLYSKIKKGELTVRE